MNMWDDVKMTGKERDKVEILKRTGRSHTSTKM
jgi:hypothetical protein